MNRVEFQNLAKRKLGDVVALLAAGRWSAAYYHCGYVIECGLKACIIARLESDVGLFFKERKLQENSWKHGLVDLLLSAGIKKDFDTDCTANPSLQAFWISVKDWTEASRYSEWTEAQARELYEAVTNLPDGVLAWVQKHW